MLEYPNPRQVMSLAITLYQQHLRILRDQYDAELFLLDELLGEIHRHTLSDRG
jgi:hypothetical protein